jgi:hypothetical protein
MRIAGSGATNAGPCGPRWTARPASTPRSMAQAGGAGAGAVLHQRRRPPGRAGPRMVRRLRRRRSGRARRPGRWRRGRRRRTRRWATHAGPGIVARSAPGQADGHPAGVVRAGVTLDEALAPEPAQGQPSCMTSSAITRPGRRGAGADCRRGHAQIARAQKPRRPGPPADPRPPGHVPVTTVATDMTWARAPPGAGLMSSCCPLAGAARRPRAAAPEAPRSWRPLSGRAGQAGRRAG